MGSAAGKERSHLVEQSGYAGELCREASVRIIGIRKLQQS